jgi:hypothetical protein
MTLTVPPLIRPLLALGTAVSLAACSTASPPPADRNIPSYLLAPTGCAIVAGGDIGSRFSDRQVAAMWSKINAAITTELHQRLVFQNYKAVALLVPVERSRQAEDLVFEQAALRRCNRVLQVSHVLAEDASGKYFRFDVALFRAQPKQDATATTDAGITVVATGEFQRSYRYPRTQQSFENFYAGTVADQVFADLTAAGALVPLR